jgi:hypothetical protein
LLAWCFYGIATGLELDVAMMSIQGDAQECPDLLALVFNLA